MQCARPWKGKGSEPEAAQHDSNCDTQPADLSPIAKSFRLSCQSPVPVEVETTNAVAPLGPIEKVPLPALPAPAARAVCGDETPADSEASAAPKSEVPATLDASSEGCKHGAGKGDDDLFHVPPPAEFSTRQEQFTEYEQGDKGLNEEDQEPFSDPELEPKKKKAKAKGKAKGKAAPKGKAKSAAKAKAKGKAAPKGKANSAAKAKAKGKAAPKGKANSAAKAKAKGKAAIPRAASRLILLDDEEASDAESESKKPGTAVRRDLEDLKAECEDLAEKLQQTPEDEVENQKTSKKQKNNKAEDNNSKVLAKKQKRQPEEAKASKRSKKIQDQKVGCVNKYTEAWIQNQFKSLALAFEQSPGRRGAQGEEDVRPALQTNAVRLCWCQMECLQRSFL